MQRCGRKSAPGRPRYSIDGINPRPRDLLLFGACPQQPESNETADPLLSLSSLHCRNRGIPRPGPVVASLGPLLLRPDPAPSPDTPERIRPGIDLGPRSPPD